MNNDATADGFRATSRWVREQLGGEGTSATPQESAVLAEVLRSMRRLRHGTIQLQVQDARVVQIDVTEKRRL